MKGGNVKKGVEKEETMSGDSAALIIFIVFCRVLPRMAAHTHSLTHLPQLAVFDLADTDTV